MRDADGAFAGKEEKEDDEDEDLEDEDDAAAAAAAALKLLPDRAVGTISLAGTRIIP